MLRGAGDAAHPCSYGGRSRSTHPLRFEPAFGPTPAPYPQEDAMQYQAVNLQHKFGLFNDKWQPKVVAEMNDYQFKVVKIDGDFVWHHHEHTDETFIVFEGNLRIDFRDGSVNLGAGEMYVVPKGIEHKPFADGEVKLLLIEPRGVLNTGSAGGERSALNDVWV
jgi:mannose-6-phosphate isomerase-like protein (cupin superfamily)